MIKNPLIPLGLLLLSTLAPAVYGEAPRERNSSLSIGAFSGVRNSEYRSEKNKVLVLPYLTGSLGRFRFEGRSLSYQMIPGPFPYSLSLKVDYFSAGFDPKRSPELGHLSKRRSTVHLGLESRVMLPARFSLRLGVGQDILGVSDGQDATLSLGRLLFLGPRLQVIPSLGVSFWSKSIVRTYYGIRAHEATAALAEYDPGESALFPQASMVVIIGLGGQWRANVFANRTFLSSNARRSPLTDQSTRDFLGLGVSYTF